MVDLKYEMDGLIPLPGAPKRALRMVLTVPKKLCLTAISFVVGSWFFALFFEEEVPSESSSKSAASRSLLLRDFDLVCMDGGGAGAPVWQCCGGFWFELRVSKPIYQIVVRNQ